MATMSGSRAVEVVKTKVEDHITKTKNSKTWTEFFFNGMAFVAVGTAATAIFVEGGLVVSLVSGVCAFLGPCAALQQHRLGDLEEMRILNQKLRLQVNVFQDQVAGYKKENETLAHSVKDLKKTASNLKELQNLQGKNLDTLLKQVEEYRKIQDSVKESLEAKVIQNLVSVVIRSDNDQDFVIDKNEIDGLLTRMEHIPGVDFSKENFAIAIADSGFDLRTLLEEQGGLTLEAVMSVVKNLLDDDVPVDKNIFTLHPEELTGKPGKVSVKQRFKPKSPSWEEVLERTLEL